jgi:Cu+-exporting ATPase
VDYVTGRTTFGLDDPHKLEAIVASVSRLGYSVVDQSKHSHQPSRFDSLHIQAVISALLTLPMLVAMFAPGSLLHNPWLQWALATPVFLIGVLHFGASGLRSIRAGVANMDVLITLGIVAGYIASVVSLLLNLSHETIFFEATSSIVTFVLIGHLLEERAVHKTTSAIESLAALQPRSAVRVTLGDNGQASGHESILAEEIALGDLLQVNTGDTIPTDATVEHGSLSCNEMMISGEALPVEKSFGARVIGGSIVASGSAVVRACAVGDDTVLASIVRLVHEARGRKPQIQRIGDAVSAVFVPGVILLSVVALSIGLLVYDLTFAQALVRALAIAVVACPCAMGLATPTAIMVALGKAATSGVLVRGGDTLERLAAVHRIVFDKTGTLTTGDLKVRSLVTSDSVSQDSAKAIISSLQRHSSHPIAKALTRQYGSVQSSPAVFFTSVTETQGVGLEGTASDGSHYVCGGERVRQKYGISSHDNDLVLLKDGELIAAVSFEDSIRPEALRVVQKLRALNLDLAITSGDSAHRVREVGEHLSISSLHAQTLPHEKLGIIRDFQAQTPIAYVGDGINDAPTLAEASVGISLGSASDVAINSAQIVLSGNSLEKLPQTIELARLTVRTIRQNLFWAFMYNIIAIPLAASGYISPLAGALLMTFSDVIIVANSLRIKLFKLNTRPSC